MSRDAPPTTKAPKNFNTPTTAPTPSTSSPTTTTAVPTTTTTTVAPTPTPIATPLYSSLFVDPLPTLANDTQNGNATPIALPDSFHSQPIKAVVLLLANSRTSVLSYQGVSEKRIVILRTCLLNFDQVYNSVYGPYPVVIFHEDLLDSDMNYLTELVSARTVVTFIKIDFVTIPHQIKTEKVQAWIDGAEGSVTGRPVGYRMMCRFWSGVVQNHPSLANFTHYMRLDDDSRFGGTPPKDLFEISVNQGVKYMDRVKMTDSWGSEQLHEAYKNYIATYPQDVQGTLNTDQIEWVKRHQQHPYTNFHLSTFDFWRSQRFLRFFTMCDAPESNLFLKYRVGDTTFISYPMNMFLAKHESMEETGFNYTHNFHNFDAGSTKLRFTLNSDFILFGLNVTSTLKL
jgi:hypothetical protein